MSIYKISILVSVLGALALVSAHADEVEGNIPGSKFYVPELWVCDQYVPDINGKPMLDHYGDALRTLVHIGSVTDDATKTKRHIVNLLPSGRTQGNEISIYDAHLQTKTEGDVSKTTFSGIEGVEPKDARVTVGIMFENDHPYANISVTVTPNKDGTAKADLTASWWELEFDRSLGDQWDSPRTFTSRFSKLQLTGMDCNSLKR